MTERPEREASTQGTPYSSRQTEEGREGFTPGEDVSNRPDFVSRENRVEERQERALEPGETPERGGEATREDQPG